MTDIVTLDHLRIDEAYSFNYANKFFSSATATDSLTGGGGRFHITLVSTAVAFDVQPRIVRKMSLTSSAVGAAAAEPTREIALTSEITPVEVLTTNLVTMAALRADAVASDTPDVRQIAHYESSAEASDTAELRRRIALAESAEASDVATTAARRKGVYAESAIASDTLDARRVLATSSTAEGSDQVTSIRAHLTYESTAVASDVLSGGRRVTMELTSVAVGSDALTASARMTMELASEAEAYDALRLPAGAIPGLWFNTTTAAYAEWQGMPFNSMLEIDGTVYGASADGIHPFTPKAEDAAGAMDSGVTWDLMDLGSPQRKRLGGIYVVGYAEAPFDVAVICHQGSFTYPARLPPGEHRTNHRATPGRGLDSPLYRFAVSNTGYYDVRGVIVDNLATARRI